MSLETAAQAKRARVIVIGNEKGGSGKSTVAIHLAIALMKSGQNVASLDLDSRQKSFTHYIENRHAWAQQSGLNLEIPDHHTSSRRWITRPPKMKRRTEMPWSINWLRSRAAATSSSSIRPGVTAISDALRTPWRIR